MERERNAARASTIAHRFLSRWRDVFTNAGVDDLVQETVIEVMRRERTVRCPDRFGAFVRTVSRRCRSKALARHLRHSMTSLEADAELAAGLAAAPAELRLLRVGQRVMPFDWCLHELDDVLVGLAPTTRRILLSFYEGFSLGELAERFGVPHDTLKVRLYRTRQRIRRELERRAEVSVDGAEQRAPATGTNGAADDDDNSKDDKEQTMNRFAVICDSAGNGGNIPRERRPRRLIAALSLAALCCGIPVAAQAAPPDRAAAVPAAAADARGALRRAADAVAQVKGLKAAARAAALDRAATAYRAVLEAHAGDRPACAQAWFELGEIARRKGALAEAESAYAKAVELDFDRYGERGLTERGHMLRRLKRYDEAIADYRRAATISPESARAHTARTWVGRCLQDKGDLDAAVAAHREALEVTTEPKRVIEVCNWLAKACLAKGDLEGAEAALARAETVVPDGESPEAESVRHAFDDMSARRAVLRARDKTSGAAGDAADVETSRGR